MSAAREVVVRTWRKVAWTRRSPLTTRVDVLLAVSVVVALGAGITAWFTVHTYRPDVGAYLFAVGLGALMLVGRRWPVPVLVTTLAALIVYYRLDYPPVGVAVPIGAALYTVAESGRLRWAVGGGALALAASTLWRWREGDENVAYLFGYELISSLALMATLVALGDAVRSRRGWQAEIERREQLARAEREREAARRVEEERLHIAREVHDVLAHTVSVIAIQADVAAEALDDDRRAVSSALEVIRASSREALGGLRSTVGVLRGTSAGTATGAPRDPVGGVAQLDRLVHWATAAGLHVQLEIEGVPRPLPVVVDAAVHRIVQEAVTNVLRHADATRARVELRYLTDALTVRVVDDGRAGVPVAPNGADRTDADNKVDHEGYGLRGMRERVSLLGGQLQVGPRDRGGFAVEATLPVGRAE